MQRSIARTRERRAQREALHEMTKVQHRIRQSWMQSILAAVCLGLPDAAYRLTVAYVRRLREAGVGV